MPAEVREYCYSLGVKEVLDFDMKLEIDLPKPADSNILQTYTVDLTNGTKLEITGNTILNWKLIEIRI